VRGDFIDVVKVDISMKDKFEFIVEVNIFIVLA
jgi:hypothetical protein